MLCYVNPSRKALASVSLMPSNSQLAALLPRASTYLTIPSFFSLQPSMTVKYSHINLLTVTNT